jgi:thiol:disulfide interchange protein
MITSLLAIGGAILGGLLLNVMPCVFPVLSIKALSLVRSGGENEGEARGEALSYTAGAIVVCAGLGATLIALRSAGHIVGWAFQLQDVRVIILLMLLVTAIALNLAGLFEMPTISGGVGLAGKKRHAGAFWTGAFAAFVATPCSGPFMGAALGAALLLPAPAAILVFAGLGLGLALPFLLIGFVPALRHRLPRPGPWMNGLRRGLSVPMFATAVGLAWIAGRQAGVDVMALALGALTVFALLLWRVGTRQTEIGARAWWALVPALVVAAAVLHVVSRTSSVGTAIIADAERSPQKFDEKRLAALRAEGKPVFLYFTADWCVTCKVNEQAALGRSEVHDAFARKNVIVMIGDWTNGDPAIGRFLERQGRSSVPYYIFYPEAGAAPKVLPQLLTPQILTDLS